MAVEAEEYLRTLERMLRQAGRRVGDADEVELGMLIALQRTLDEAIQVAVDGQRSTGSTWEMIAAATGVTRQAAYQRWGQSRARILEAVSA